MTLLQAALLSREGRPQEADYQLLAAEAAKQDGGSSKAALALMCQLLSPSARTAAAADLHGSVEDPSLALARRSDRTQGQQKRDLTPYPPFLSPGGLSSKQSCSRVYLRGYGYSLEPSAFLP